MIKDPVGHDREWEWQSWMLGNFRFPLSGLQEASNWLWMLTFLYIYFNIFTILVTVPGLLWTSLKSYQVSLKFASVVYMRIQDGSFVADEGWEDITAAEEGVWWEHAQGQELGRWYDGFIVGVLSSVQTSRGAEEAHSGPQSVAGPHDHVQPVPRAAAQWVSL